MISNTDIPNRPTSVQPTSELVNQPSIEDMSSDDLLQLYNIALEQIDAQYRLPAANQPAGLDEVQQEIFSDIHDVKIDLRDEAGEKLANLELKPTSADSYEDYIQGLRELAAAESRIGNEGNIEAANALNLRAQELANEMNDRISSGDLTDNRVEVQQEMDVNLLLSQDGTGQGMEDLMRRLTETRDLVSNYETDDIEGFAENFPNIEAYREYHEQLLEGLEASPIIDEEAIPKFAAHFAAQESAYLEYYGEPDVASVADIAEPPASGGVSSQVEDGFQYEENLDLAGPDVAPNIDSVIDTVEANEASTLTELQALLQLQAQNAANIALIENGHIVVENDGSDIIIGQGGLATASFSQVNSGVQQVAEPATPSYDPATNSSTFNITGNGLG